MKKILIICGKLCVGGAEKIAYSIGHHADTSKHQCHYIVFGNTVGEYEEQLLKDGCQIFHLPSPGEGYLKYWKNLIQLMNTYHYDVVHCHTMFNSGIVLLAAKLKKIPCRIAHSHSICSSPKRPLVKRIYENVMRGLILKCATNYVACGQKAGEWLYGEKAFQEFGQLLLNGIDTARFRYNEESRKRIREKLVLGDCLVIGHVGHLLEVKNQIFLLNLMPELIKRNLNTKLLLVGEGQDRLMLEKKIQELKLSEYVIMTGNVMNVQDYLSAMDVFAFPSLYEGMPLAMIEVQANGLPCVMSDAVPKDVHLTDLIQVLSLKDSKERWTEAICSSHRKDSRDYAKYIYENGHDIEMVVKKIYALYDGV